MDRERWARVRAIFEDVINALPEEQAAMLDRACGTDEALRAEVEALLLADRGATHVVLAGAAAQFFAPAAVVGGAGLLGALGLLLISRPGAAPARGRHRHR